MTQAYKTMGETYREIYGQIPEGYEGNILTHLKDVGIDGRFFYGSLILRKKDVSKAKAHIKKGYNDPGTLVTKHKMPKIVAAEYDPTLDEAYKLPRQLKDPKKEVMVSKDKYGTIVIDKKDWPSYKSKGWKLAEELELEEGRMKDLHLYIQQKKSAEWIAKKMKLDVKTVKALMSSVEYEYDPDKDSNKEKIKEAEDDESEDEKIKKAKDKADKDVQVALLKKKIADLSQKNEELNEKSKYLQYSNLLLQKGKLLGKGFIPTSITVTRIDKEIAKELKKLGIKDSFGEELELTEFTDAQIARLKKEYESLRGKETGINPEKFSKLRKMMRRFKKPQLLKLASADIPILTTSAKASLVINHGMKWSAIPEELVPYADELEEGTKFGSVDDKVMKRIELMIKGTREMKNSIQNMLNYLMPPEVVDMVKDKFGIKEPRGKIKIR